MVSFIKKKNEPWIWFVKRKKNACLVAKNRLNVIWHYF